MKVGLLFSGQGAQKTGMGQDLYQHNETYRAAIDHASEVVDLDLPKLYFDDQCATQLNQTLYAQPAIVAMSCALYQVVADQLPEVAAGIGLSLGEYSALAAAENVSVDDALRLVKRRGELMQAASDATPSKMVAVMNTSLDVIQAACQSARSIGIVAVANINTPKQVVISGEIDAVDAAVQYLSDNDVKRMVPLAVSGAFHTPLMASAQSELHEELSKIQWHEGAYPVISNTTGEPFEPTELTETLTQQLVSTTRFADAIQQLDGKVDTVIELGPGKTLMSFARKTINGINYFHIDDEATLTATLSAVRSV